MRACRRGKTPGCRWTGRPSLERLPEVPSAAAGATAPARAYFVHASLDKIADPAAFAKVVYQWQVLGPVLSNLLAVTLPWVEILAGGLLIFGVWRKEAALVIALLLVVFLLARGLVLARGIDIENCGCTSLAKSEQAAPWPPAWTRASAGT